MLIPRASPLPLGHVGNMGKELLKALEMEMAKTRCQINEAFDLDKYAHLGHKVTKFIREMKEARKDIAKLQCEQKILLKKVTTIVTETIIKHPQYHLNNNELDQLKDDLDVLCRRIDSVSTSFHNKNSAKFKAFCEENMPDLVKESKERRNRVILTTDKDNMRFLMWT